ncbi:hypothetical protein BB559_005855, partial [Furculomyces boomerangus]
MDTISRSKTIIVNGIPVGRDVFGPTNTDIPGPGQYEPTPQTTDSYKKYGFISKTNRFKDPKPVHDDKTSFDITDYSPTKKLVRASTVRSKSRMSVPGNFGINSPSVFHSESKELSPRDRNKRLSVVRADLVGRNSDHIRNFNLEKFYESEKIAKLEDNNSKLQKEIHKLKELLSQTKPIPNNDLTNRSDIDTTDKGY